MTDTQFDGWKRLLKGEKVNFNQDEPLSGYWRSKRFKDGPLEPVVIWRDDDGLNVQCAGKDVDYSKVWPWCARNPVSYAAYQTRMETGQWPDIDATVHAQATAQAGDNNAPTDPAVILAEQIEAAKAGADAYAKIGDKETPLETGDAMAAKAQTLRSRLLELHGQADKHREALKRPHLDANTSIDAKWQPIVRTAKAAADAIRTAMEEWETIKLQRRRKQEAEEAEKLRAHQASVAKAAAEAAAAGKPAPAPPPPPAASPPLQPMASPIKGAAGRSASSKPKMVVTEITNIDAVFYFVKDHPEVRPWLMALAQRAVDSGREVPGVKVEEKMKVT